MPPRDRLLGPARRRQPRGRDLGRHRRRAPALGAHRRRRDLRRRSCATSTARNPGFRLHEQLTGEHGPHAPADLDELCPDWRERETFLSGPAEMLDAIDGALGASTATRDRLHMEHFQPDLGERGEQGEGGTIRFCASDVRGRVRRPTADPRRRRGRRARRSRSAAAMGICHTCVGRLRSGQDPRPAHRRGPRPGRRDGPHLHQRARGRGRDRTLTPQTTRNAMATTDREPARRA